MDIKYYKNYIITDNIINYHQYCQINDFIKREKHIYKLFNITLNLYSSYEIEDGIFNFSILYVYQKNLFKLLINKNLFHDDTLETIYNVYKYKFRSIVDYLKTLPNFLNNILSNSIKPNYVAFLSPQEIDPLSFKDILEKRQKKEEKINNIVYSDVYICKKCKQMKCTSKIIATRAADENLTTIVKCHNCYNIFTV